MKKTISRWIAALRPGHVSEGDGQAANWFAWLAAGRQGRSMNG